MKFLYLTQTAGPLPDHYARIRRRNADLLVLTYRVERPDAIFAPGTTWTEGRNILWRHAREHHPDADYYVFLDDDISLLNFDWGAFEAALKRYRPAIGFPRGWAWAPETSLPVHTCRHFDAMMNAFHRDVMWGGQLFPYFDGLDPQSWYFSQLVLTHISAPLHLSGTLMFRDLEILNEAHSDYPKPIALKWQFGAAENWMLETVWNTPEEARAIFRPHPRSRLTQHFPDEQPPAAPESRLSRLGKQVLGRPAPSTVSLDPGSLYARRQQEIRAGKVLLSQSDLDFRPLQARVENLPQRLRNRLRTRSR